MSDVKQTRAAFTPRERRGFSSAFWMTLITLLLLVGSIELYAFLQLSVVTQALHEGSAAETVTAHGDTGHINPARLNASDSDRAKTKVHWRTRLVQASFKAARQEYEVLHKSLRVQTEADLTEARGALLAQVPMWADWYYSVIGEYVRLGHLGAQAVSGSSFNDYMIDQLSERVFKPARLSERLTEINEERKAVLTEQHEAVITHLTSVLKHQNSVKVDWSTQDQNQLKERFDSLEKLEHVATLSPLGLAAKLTTLTGVKLGLKALAARSAVKLGSVGVAKGAAAVGVKAGGKLGVKVGVRGGSVVASGASATLACSPLGLAAPVCGVAAGLVTWFAVDKAIVEVDELINREDFEDDLQHELNSVMDELESQVLTGIESHHQQILNALWSAKHDAKPSQKNRKTRLIDHIQAPPSVTQRSQLKPDPRVQSSALPPPQSTSLDTSSD